MFKDHGTYSSRFMVGLGLYTNFPSNTGVSVSARKSQDALTAYRIKLERKAASTNLGVISLTGNSIEDARLAKEAIVSDVFATHAEPIAGAKKGFVQALLTKLPRAFVNPYSGLGAHRPLNPFGLYCCQGYLRECK
ncbi:uncharacterized protein BDW70DRAFT_158560 [Aspergillus foveolatus]|uniref:uncharacterized protein n=1 Tax=Aspergillus foveolatus TaxID=210207 RepID=UPI003CCE4B9F